MDRPTRAQIDAAQELGIDGDVLARMTRAEVANWIIEQMRERRKDDDNKKMPVLRELRR